MKKGRKTALIVLGAAVIIDAAPSLLGDNGLPRDDIFRMDGLHFNEKGV